MQCHKDILILHDIQIQNIIIVLYLSLTVTDTATHNKTVTVADNSIGADLLTAITLPATLIILIIAVLVMLAFSWMIWQIQIR